MPRTICSLLLAAVVMTASQAAHADEADRWYGWQTLAVDAAAGLLVPAAIVANDKGCAGCAVALGTVSGAIFLAGAPELHALHHGSSGKSLGDLVGRTLVAGTGTLFGLLVAFATQVSAGAPCESAACQVHYQPASYYIIKGTLIGGGIAALADAILLARESVLPGPGPALSVAPLILPRGSSTAAGVMLVAAF